MKPTDLSVHLTGFLSHHLAAQRNLSPNTIRPTAIRSRCCCGTAATSGGCPSNACASSRSDVPLVEAFLDHLEHDRHASIRTRNYRLAALHAFFRYVQSEVPDHLLQCQRIIAIPLRRHPPHNRGLPCQGRSRGGSWHSLTPEHAVAAGTRFS